MNSKPQAESRRKKLGVALGGGSARGLAHIGVLCALEQEGVPVDMVSGCSMGAIVGGIYACGCDVSYLDSFIRAIDLKKLYDYTVPAQGYVRGRKIQELIRLLTRGYTFAQTKIPFACVAVDIEAGSLVTFREGPLHEAIRASISIPGVFIPHQYKGRVYVDGGVLDRDAVDAAWSLRADIVAASDVGYRGEILPRPRNIIQVLENSFTVASWALTKEQLRRADIVIQVPLEDINPNTTDDKDIAVIIERGREAARKSAPDIKEMLQIK